MKYLLLSVLAAGSIYSVYSAPVETSGYINCTYTHNGDFYAYLTVPGNQCPAAPEPPAHDYDSARSGLNSPKKHDPSCIIDVISFTEPGL